MGGTTIEAKVSRVVDGDTIRVFLPDQDGDESLRILSLDTEESRAGGGKPVTPWGKKAKQKAQSFFGVGDSVQLEFPGNEPLAVCLTKYRGNFGRLLVFVHKNSIDYQELMIREGYSPYFTKYGNAQFETHHKKYQQAERIAQSENLGVWNQIEVNGSEIRNYVLLGTWWKLRAAVIDKYRQIKGGQDSLFNTRLDYSQILELAKAGNEVTVFTELREIKRIAGHSAIVRIGSIEQPFSLFIADTETENGQAIINLMEKRYMSKGELHPNRGYAYITGPLSLFRDDPQMVLNSMTQITDEMP